MTKPPGLGINLRSHALRGNDPSATLRVARLDAECRKKRVPTQRCCWKDDPIPLPCPRERADELAVVRSWLAHNPVTLIQAGHPLAEPVAGGAQIARVLTCVRDAELPALMRRRD